VGTKKSFTTVSASEVLTTPPRKKATGQKEREKNNKANKRVADYKAFTELGVYSDAQQTDRYRKGHRRRGAEKFEKMAGPQVVRYFKEANVASQIQNIEKKGGARRKLSKRGKSSLPLTKDPRTETLKKREGEALVFANT